MSTGTTLYYPYIHPRDANHLKAALIYWDRIRRIVPGSIMHGTRVMNDDEDSSILAGRGVLISTHPEPYEEAAAARFFDRLKPDVKRFRIDKETGRRYAERNQGMHIEKFSHNVIDRLHEMGVAHKFGAWVAMDERLGAFYMFCLASEMAEKMAAPLFTDSRKEANIGQALLFAPTPEEDVSDMLVSLGIRLPSPKQLQGVPMEVVVDFAEQRAVERQRFRAVIEGILATAKTFHDPNAIADYLSSNQKLIEEAVSDLRKAIDELRVGGVTSVAKITVPAGAAAAIAALPFSPETAAILGALGLAISGIACFAETRGKLRQARTGSPYHYLISVSNKFRINEK